MHRPRSGLWKRKIRCLDAKSFCRFGSDLGRENAMSFPIKPRLQCFSNPCSWQWLGNRVGVPVKPDKPSTWALAELKWTRKAWPTDLNLHLPCIIRGDGINGDDGGVDGGGDGELEKSTKSCTHPQEYGFRPKHDQRGRAPCFSTCFFPSQSLLLSC